MSTDLVYRLRTCAAAIAASTDSGNPWDMTLIANDAADLLIEASNLLDAPEELGEPMEVLEAKIYGNNRASDPNSFSALWGGDLPPSTPNPCPSCGDNFSARMVKRNGRKLMLTCPKCSAAWEYGKHGA